ncbi:MAG: hypothetical protein M1833_007393, partial [Piccolia ochrophora]
PWVEREESTAHKLGRLRERVVLYDATLQSIDSINDLPGVAADTNFVQELRSKRLYFQALKCLALSRCHSILSSPTHALALLSHASTHITTALPLLPHTSSQTPPFTLAPTTLSTLQSLLTHELTRHRALVELSNLTAQTAPPSSSPHAAGAAKHVPAEHTPPLIDDLTTYPPLGAVVDCAHLVTYPPRVEPVPVKPLFLDLAWNYVAYPGREGVGAGGEREEEEEGKEREEGKGKKGWFGFGR